MTSLGEGAWRDAVNRRYDAGVRAYDELWSPVILPAAEELVAALEVGDAHRVLDVGCGTGALLPVLRSAAPRAALAGLDLSLGMLRLARARGLAVARADASALPVARGCCDVVLLAYVLFHLADPPAALRAAHEALRAGGKVGTVTWAAELGARADETITAALDDVGAPAAPTVSDHGRTDSIGKMQGLFDATGFRTDRAWTVTIEHTFTADSLLSLRVEGGTGRVRFDGLEPETRAATIATIRDQLVSLPGDDFRFAGELVLATAVRP